MIEAFQERDGKLMSAIDARERNIMARVFRDVHSLVTARDVGQIHPQQRAGENARDIEILQALDFTPEVELADLPPLPSEAERQEASLPPPDDPALASLFPPLSDDEEEAGRLRAQYDAGLRAEKSRKIANVLAELLAPSGPGDRVVAHDPVEWVQAFNDVRIVLAERFGLFLVGELSEVSQLMKTDAYQEEEKLLFAIFEMLTWWQNSLITALGDNRGAH